MASAPSLRKRLLHVLLWFLAASAASGVLTVLVPQRDILWRVTAMGFVAVAAIALMIPMSILADRERFRAAGLFGMCACVAAFVVSTGLIWAGLGGWRMEERFGMTLGLVVFMSPAVVGFLCLRALETGRMAAVVGLALSAIASAFFLTAIWLVSTTPFDRIMGILSMSGVAIFWTGLPASLCLIGLGHDKWYWRWIGVGGAVAALVLWLNGIWTELDGDPAFVVIPMSIAVLGAFANVLLRSHLRNGPRLVVYGTIAAAAATALFVDLNVLTDDGPYMDRFGFERFTAGAAIVTVSGTLAVIVLTMLNRWAMRRVAYAARTIPATDGPAGVELKTISLRCPRCTKEQTLPLGQASCTECRLIIKTAVEVPACRQCGYDISMIKGDKCPECGAGIG
jgi:MFS family permease